MSKFDYELVYKISTLGKKELRKYLIKHSVKIKKRVNAIVDQYGRSLLCLAISRNLVSAAQVLLDLGADVNKTDNFGNSPLAVAINLINPEMVELLLKYKPDFYKGFTRVAFYGCFYETDSYRRRIIKSMLKHGFRIDTSQDPFDSETLSTCIKHGFMDMAISILDHGDMKDYDFFYDIIAWSKYLKLHTRPYTKLQNKISNRLASIFDLFIICAPPIRSNRNYHIAEIICFEDLNDLLLIHIFINNTGYHDFHRCSEYTVQNIILNCYDANKPICDYFERRNFLHHACINYSKYPEMYGLRLLRVLFRMNFNINTVDRLGRTPLDYTSEGYFSAHIGSLEEDRYKVLIVQLHKYVKKLDFANFYVSEHNTNVINMLFRCLQQRPSSQVCVRQIMNETRMIAEELLLLMDYPINNSISLYDLFNADVSTFYVFEDREDIKRLFQQTNFFRREFQYYGPLLHYKYEQLYLKRGLIRPASFLLYETLQYRTTQLIVHKIAHILTTNELFKLLYVDP